MDPLIAFIYFSLILFTVYFPSVSFPSPSPFLLTFPCSLLLPSSFLLFPFTSFSLLSPSAFPSPSSSLLLALFFITTFLLLRFFLCSTDLPKEHYVQFQEFICRFLSPSKSCEKVMEMTKLFTFTNQKCQKSVVIWNCLMTKKIEPNQ